MAFTWQPLPECGFFSVYNFSLFSQLFVGSSSKVWHYLMQNSILSLFLSLKLENSFNSTLFFTFFELSWPFRQIGRIVNKYKAEITGWASLAGESLRQASSREQIGRAYSALFCWHFSMKNVKEALKGGNNQEIVKNAQKSHYLTMTTIWQRLPGNVKFLPRSSR